MSVKIIKATRFLGNCNHDGLSFQEHAFIEQARVAFLNAQNEAKKRDAATTGPARVYITVEQEVIIDD